MTMLPDDFLLLTPSRHYAPVTKDDDHDLPDGVCVGLLVGAPGSANLVQPDGAVREGVPLQQGYNQFVVRRVKTGGTADDIWALYS